LYNTAAAETGEDVEDDGRDGEIGGGSENAHENAQRMDDISKSKRMRRISKIDGIA